MPTPDYSQLISAISQATQNEAESNPWLLGAQVLQQTQIPQSLAQDNPWLGIGLGLGKGFLGGAAQMYGTDQVRDYQRGLGAELPGYFQSQLADKPGFLATSKYLKDIGPALAVSDQNIAQSKLGDTQDLTNALTKDVLSQKAQEMLLEGKEPKIIKNPDGSLDITSSSPTSEEVPVTTGRSPEEQARFEELNRQNMLIYRNRAKAAQATIEQLRDEKVQRNPFLSNRIPPQTKQSLMEGIGALETMDYVKGKLDALGDEGTLEYQLKNKLAATEAGKTKLAIQFLARNVASSLEGGRPSNFDSASYEKIMAGDFSVPPKQIKQLVAQMQEIMAVKHLGTISAVNAAMKGGTDELTDKFNKYLAPTTPSQAPITETVGVFNPKTGSILRVPKGDPRLAQVPKESIRP